ncbi:MAG: aldo/keto reductase [Rhodobacteraceae bacterium]|jgi:predicted oxidoreductase|nr:aldo/keto reductase [Paracoccaceae bacterium]
MERATLAPGLELSRIVYGLWRVMDDVSDPRHVQEKLEACLENGITTLDLADIYGHYLAESALGGAFRAAPHLREKVEIVTKCGIVLPGGPVPARVKHYDTSARHIRASVEASLAKMRIERIDLLLLHRPDPFMDAAETARILEALVTEGKVRALGVSNFAPHDWTLLEGALSLPLVTNQIEVSLTAPQALLDGQAAFLQAKGIRPMAWSPLGRGAIFGDGNPRLGETLDEIARRHGTGRAAVALAWLMAHPAGLLPVVGTNRPERIREVAEAMAVDMDRQTWFELLAAATGQEVP